MSVFITASLVLYNTPKEDIDNVINNFFNSTGNFERLLFLVDNTVNGKNPILPDTDKQIEYIGLNQNLGFGRAHNIAMNKALELKSNYHILINPDIFFDTNVINDLRNYMESHPNVGNILPKVLYPNGDLQRLGRLLPSPLVLISRLFKLSFFNNSYELSSYRYDRIIRIPYASGCFMFLRTSILKDVGLFDNRFFMYAEDIDFSRRISSKYHNILYPYCKITHRHEKESFKSFKLMFIHTISIIRYFNKWGWFTDIERQKLNKQTINEISHNSDT